ncbi:Glucan 1,3-beta-glucosidase [Madurella mycetomatis]|uniref:Glucan 1,3-beta-glucosidase n=1 Tax=Madurella mycetomatis TaxID=100816 RepID=A0A175VRX6_9PEZI|nr:Glucan 1,3-beta-glucosidase [Madurella mycetomatis]
MRAPLLLAAALLAASAAQRIPNSPQAHARQTCQGPVVGSPQTWWRAQIGHNGTTPYAADSTFQYYRTVVQYGADSSGAEDSSDAFNHAIDAWNRTGNTVTTLPAYVYVPPGTYLIKRSIQMLVNTFLVGDPLSPPTLVADPELETNPVINGYDDHQGEGSSTKNFYMAVRNLNIDTTRIASDVRARAIDWSVSQACSLTDVHVTMPLSSGHVGITMDQGGSGKIIADCSFTGGAVGIQLANQQYMLKGLRFDGCDVGISVVRSHVTTIQGSSFTNCNYGVDVGGVDSTGAVSIVDSSVSRCNAGVNARVSGSGQGSLVLDGFAVSDAIAVRSSSGATLLQGSVPEGQTWVMGNTSPDGYQSGRTYPIRRPAGLLVNGEYFTAPLPQYENYDISQVVSVKEDPEHRVYGDNLNDDGPAINAILRKNANCKIVFFPQGIYRTNETIYVPPGSRLVGEVFSVISGTGTYFSNPDGPQPIIKVGNPDERGVAQFTDLLFSVADVLPGAIIVQVNMAGPEPGDVGFWNCAIRAGGSVDSLVSTQCSDPDPANCKAAFALLHLTPIASAYLEDVWGWVADHGLDPDLPAQNIAVGRGALVESTSPTWLVGTSFEHCVLYQYSLHGASNVYIGQHQTEAPYWQGLGTPQRAPAPWAVDSAYGDPSFDHCRDDDDQCYRAWGLHMADSDNVVIHGSAMWSFFNAMNDDLWSDPQCTLTGDICQTNMAFVQRARATWWFSVSSKSTENLVLDMGDGGEESGSDGAVLTSQRDNPGGWGAVVAAYLRNTEGEAADGDDDSAAVHLSMSVTGLMMVVWGCLYILM